MPIDAPFQLSIHEPLTDLFQALREDGTRFEQFMGQQLDELAALRTQLAEREQVLYGDEQAIREQSQAQVAECERLAALERELARKQAELDQQAEELAQSRAELDADRVAIEGERHQLDQQRDSNGEQIAALQEELARTQNEYQAQLAAVQAAPSPEALTEVQQHLEGVSGERDELARRCEELQNLHQQALDEAAADRQRLERQLSAAQEELAAASAALVAHEDLEGDSDAQSTPRLTAIQSQLEELRAERDDLRQELESANDQAARLTVTSEALTETRAELARMQSSLTKQPRSDSDELQERLREAEQERRALEDDLEAVRNRAAELAESAEAERRRATEERSAWADELKQMRRLLEQQATMLGQHDSAPPESANGPKPASAESAPGSDPVLESVMAQFEMLHKDRSRRRQKDRNGDHQQVA